MEKVNGTGEFLIMNVLVAVQAVIQQITEDLTFAHNAVQK